jgi:hypothetical protein
VNAINRTGIGHGTTQPTARRKTRTREHVIGDLAVNAVERQVLLRGYTLEQMAKDYGYDASLFVYTDQGEAEEGLAFIQVKATERVNLVRRGTAVAFRLDRSDLQRWLFEPMPVILCLYDARGDRTFWLYIQRYFETLPGFNLFAAGETVTAHIPPTQVLTPTAVGDLAEAIRRVLRQTTGRISHA